MRKAKGKIKKSTALKLANQYIEMCRLSGININKAFLFGSYSKGTSQSESDIDVLLVGDSFINNTFENWKMLAPITARLYDVEPHPYPTKMFIKGDPFVDEIKRTGIEINLD